MINWKVRVRQRWFWITLIPLLFLLFDQVWELVGLLVAFAANGGALYDSPIMSLVLSIVGVVFAILAMVGLPVDLTTEGYGDSARALTYKEPAPNASQEAVEEFEDDEKDRAAGNGARAGKEEDDDGER